MAALVSEGYDAAYLLDYEYGPTPEQVFEFQRHATRFAIQRQTMQVLGMTTALASIFKPQIVQDFLREQEQRLASLDSADHAKALKPNARTTQRVLRELGKFTRGTKDEPAAMKFAGNGSRAAGDQRRSGGARIQRQTRHPR